MKKKKMITAAMVIALAACLTGCGSGTEKDVTTETAIEQATVTDAEGDMSTATDAANSDQESDGKETSGKNEVTASSEKTESSAQSGKTGTTSAGKSENTTQSGKVETTSSGKSENTTQSGKTGTTSSEKSGNSTSGNSSSSNSSSSSTSGNSTSGNSGNSSSGGSTSSNSGKSESTTEAAPKYREEQVWIVDEEEWNEEIPIYDYIEAYTCAKCKFHTSGDNAYNEILDHVYSCISSWYDDFDLVQVDTYTVHHDEVGHWETQLVPVE